MNPAVSVIIPNYNCREYIERAIESVFIQQNVPFELIVIDDGSDDGSREYLETLSTEHDNIILLTQQRKGVVAARNRAIDIANGKYIAFLDADDYWTSPLKLYNQVEFMNSTAQCVLSFTNYMHVDEAYNPIIDCFSYWPEFYNKKIANNHDYQLLNNALSLLLYANVIGTSAVMVKTEAIINVGAFNPETKSASDWECWLKLASYGEVAYTYSCDMGYLMRQSGSITSNRVKRIESMRTIVRSITDTYQVSLLTKIRANGRLTECFGEYYREQGNYGKAFMLAVKAFICFPHRRNLRHLLHDIKQIKV